MSDPMYPPPPPSMPPPMPPMGGGMAAQQVQAPAMGLIITGALGVVGALLSLVMNVLGTGASALPGMGDMGGEAGARYVQMMSGGLGIVFALLALGIYGFVIWGALQMRQARNWNMSVGAAIGAMLPCSCCCIIGLPVGIWALIVLMKPEVKAGFTG
jgi:hypothetical protein